MPAVGLAVQPPGGQASIEVGGMPDGRLPEPALERMKGMGVWLRRFGEAIYGTRPCAPYLVGNFGFTKKGGKTYAIRTLLENEKVKELLFPFDGEVKSVTMVGSDASARRDLSFCHKHGTLWVGVPEELDEVERLAFAVEIE